MKNLCIIGDSFCFYRDNKNEHWPAILADKLNLKLTGEGYPGKSWWTTRKSLLAYKNSPEFEATKFFVICHSEPHRMLVDAEVVDNHGLEYMQEMYLKYFYNESFNEWAVTQWYKELNEILKDKTVLHVQCFRNTEQYFPVLNGIKYKGPLIDESLAEVNFNHKAFLDDDRCNHFSPAGNQQLATTFFNLL